MVRWKPPNMANLITTVDSSLLRLEEATICTAFAYNGIVYYEQQAALGS